MLNLVVICISFTQNLVFWQTNAAWYCGVCYCVRLRRLTYPRHSFIFYFTSVSVVNVRERSVSQPCQGHHICALSQCQRRVIWAMMRAARAEVSVFSNFSHLLFGVTVSGYGGGGVLSEILKPWPQVKALGPRNLTPCPLQKLMCACASGTKGKYKKVYIKKALK